MPTDQQVDPGLHHTVTLFLAREARLLDNGQFDEWLELFADDLQYRMPVRTTRSRASSDVFSDDMTYFDEDLASLTFRVKRLDTDFAWAEDPPSRTRRFVTNIEVEMGRDDGELAVRSNTLVYRNRADSTIPDLVSCARHDVLRDVGSRYLIARRTILVDQSVLGGYNLSIFF